MTEEYLRANRELWDTWADAHVVSEFYDVEAFKAGKDSLEPEDDEVGNVAGRSLLHLQCHFGMDTLSWARRGARVTGADFSERAITHARALAADLGLDAIFVCAPLHDLPDALDGRFDVVYTSRGVLSWLPDLTRWGQVVAHFLAPGGTFFVHEIHPAFQVYDDETTEPQLRVRYPYFGGGEPLRFEIQGSYAVADTGRVGVEYGWSHGLGEIVTALLDAGLRLVSLTELPTLAWRGLPFLVETGDGWRLPDGFPPQPLSFTLRATKD
jgi:SAM-dependent methyltransferase